MIGRRLRLAGLVGAGALAAWWARLLAHSKVPAPEGRWSEVTEDSLSER